MKKSYILHWIDSYNLENWKSIEKIKEHYPIDDYVVAIDNWVDCFHCWEFEACNIEEIKEKVNEYFEGIGRCIDVFSVKYNDQIILTEEDF